MHFRAHTIKIIIIVFLVFAADTSDASTASDVFHKNRVQILSQGIAFIQGYVFSKGTALPATDSANSSIYAKRKAKLSAFLILSNYIVAPTFLAGTELPGSISSKLLPKLRDELLRSTGSDLIKITGVSTVYSDFNGNQAIVVIAIKNTEIEHLKPARRIDLSKFLNEIICLRSSGIDPFLAYEICPEHDHAGHAGHGYAGAARPQARRGRARDRAVPEGLRPTAGPRCAGCGCCRGLPGSWR